MKNVLIFVFGAIAGAAGAYFYTKNKYESLIDKEIESVKEEYKKELEGKIEEIKESLTGSEKIAPDTNETNEELAEKAKNKPAPGEIIKMKAEYEKEVVRYNDYSKDDWEEYRKLWKKRSDNGCHTESRFNCYEYDEEDSYEWKEYKNKLENGHLFYGCVDCAKKVLDASFVRVNRIMLGLFVALVTCLI